MGGAICPNVVSREDGADEDRHDVFPKDGDGLLGGVAGFGGFGQKTSNRILPVFEKYLMAPP